MSEKLIICIIFLFGRVLLFVETVYFDLYRKSKLTNIGSVTCCLLSTHNYVHAYLGLYLFVFLAIFIALEKV